ncbi:MAG TPA: hypothetical protein VLT17_06735 [Gemmatimonadales bacterium]|nr:hypothetical protein [Gemmatimonadales bacterium]
MPNPLRSLPDRPSAFPYRRPRSSLCALALALFPLFLWLAACSSTSRTSRVAVDRWLTCEECNSGELAAVLALGPQTFSSLRERLLTGPDSAKLHRLEDGLAQRAHRLQDSVPLPPNHPPPAHGQLTVEEQRYVDTFLANYTAVVEKRAALALAKIGGPEAKLVLQQAGTLNLRSDVHAFVVFAHDSLWVP